MENIEKESPVDGEITLGEGSGKGMPPAMFRDE